MENTDRKPSGYYNSKENRLYELDKYIKEHGTINGITGNIVGRRIYDIFQKRKHSIYEAITELGYDINKIKINYKNNNINDEVKIKEFVETYNRLPNIEDNIQGIYIIINKLNNKAYIGQSINIKNRWRNHFQRLKYNHHYNEHLQRAWNKYGEENFEFSILEIIQDSNELTNKEEYYINLYDSCNKIKGYNMFPAGEHFKMTDEIKRKIGQGNKGKKHTAEQNKRNSEMRKGKKTKPCSEETKRKIGEAQKGEKNHMYGKHHTEKTREKMSNSRTKIDKEKALCIFEKFNLLVDNMGKLLIYKLLANEYKVNERTIRKVISILRKG